MAAALKDTALKDIRHTQVRRRPISVTDEEEDFLNSSLADTEATGVDTSSGNETDEERSNSGDGFGSDIDMFSPDQIYGEGDAERGGESGSDYVTPVRIDFEVEAEDEDMNVENQGNNAQNNDRHVPDPDARVENDATRMRISFLETQLSSLESALEQSKIEATRWELEATNQKKINNELQEEMNRMRGLSVTIRGARSSDVELKAENNDLRAKLRNEMRGMIELCAELKKAEVEIEKLNQSNTMLTAEMEDAQRRALAIERRLHFEENEDGATNPAGLTSDAMDTEIADLNVGEGANATGRNDAIDLSGNQKEMDIICVSEVRTPKQDLDTGYPFVNDQPSWTIMSQPLDEAPVDDTAQELPLTYVSPSQLQIIDLHTSINQLKQQESKYLKELADKEARIQNLTKMLEPEEGVVLAVAAQQSNDGANGNHVVTDLDDPDSIVATRTRSRRPDVTPIALNEEMDLGKNYRNYAVYRQLHVDAQHIIDGLVASTNKTRYISAITFYGLFVRRLILIFR